MVEKLKEQIKVAFDNEVITLNGKEYISMDMFMNALNDSMIYESLLGVLIKKEGDKVMSDEEILMYISNDYEKTQVVYSDNKYKLKRSSDTF